jgi:hypothetical protein
MSNQNLPTVKVQDGPTPGYAFAVFRDNPEYHDLPDADWQLAAKRALERHVGILGGMLVGPIRPEPLRPTNFMCEYRVTP